MLWLVALLPLLAAPLLYSLGRRSQPALLGWLGAALTLATGVLALLAVLGDWQATYRWSSHIVLSANLSTASATFALVVPLVAAPIVLYSAFHEAGSSAGTALARLIALLLAFVGAMELLVLADDLLTLLIAWELVGALSWALIGHRWHQRKTSRDAAWAFLVTRFGDLGLYIAAAAAYAGTGSFAYDGLGQLDGANLQVFAAGIVLATAAKSAQLPFSPWLFAAMSGPTPVSALLHAATMVAAGVYLIVRLHPTLAGVSWFAPLAITLGLATALAGGLVASLQGHAKKLLAASTSAHYGLMWLAVGAGYPGVALLHFVVHAFMKGVLFLAAGIAEHHTGSYSLGAMRLGRQLPGIALATLVASLALAGVPPLGGGWSKERIISAAGHQIGWLAVIAAIAGGLSALYATRFQLLAFGRGPQVGNNRSKTPGHTAPEALALYSLAGVSLMTALLWWPGMAGQLERLLSIDLPAGTLRELLMSLGLVLAGIVLGTLAVQRSWANHDADNPRFATASDWLGLPLLAERGASGLQCVSRALARFDDRVIDAVPRAIAGYPCMGERLSRFDHGVIDAVVRGSASATAWLAARSSQQGETLFDGISRGSATASAWLAGQARRLQSGQMHHYYTGVAVGLAAILIILGIGALL